MFRSKRRLTPKNYKGTDKTSHHVKDVIPSVMSKISAHYQNRPEQVLASWSQVIGPELANMTQAISFHEGILKVRVNNSTLLSLLRQHERVRLLATLKKRLPHVEIKNIHFQIG